MKSQILFLAAALLLAAAFPRIAVADHIAGTGALSGALDAPAPVTAVKIFAYQTEKKIRYMVFTAGGHYEFVNLFPGHYAVTIEKNGFAADPRQVDIQPDQQAKLDIALKPAPLVDRYIGARWMLDKQSGKDRLAVTYNAIYPPGPGRDIAERTCLICHGANFLPAMPQSREAWASIVDFMTTGHAFGNPDNPPMLAPERLSPSDREVLLDYLAENLGPDKPERVVKEETLPPMDEAILGKAEYIEYQFPNADNQFPNPAKVKRTTQEITFDKDGDVWLTQTKRPGGIIRLDPRTGIYKDYPTPNPGWAPHGLTSDADGSIWWAGTGAWAAHLDPKTGDLDVYPPDHKGGGLSIIFDSKGTAWWSDLPGNVMGKWDRATDKITSWRSPTPNGAPYGIIVDHQDKVWYSEFFGCNVVRLDPDTEKFTVFPSPSKPCTSRRLGVDSKNIIWFGMWYNGQLGRLDPATGKITIFQIPVPFADPYDVWVDNADNVWTSSDNYLVKLDQTTGKFTYYPTPQQTDEPKITITRDDAIWFPPRGWASSGHDNAGAVVLYPDKARMKELGAYFSDNDVNNRLAHYKGPFKTVAGTGNDGGGPAAMKRGTEKSNDLGSAAD